MTENILNDSKEFKIKNETIDSNDVYRSIGRLNSFRPNSLTGATFNEGTTRTRRFTPKVVTRRQKIVNENESAQGSKSNETFKHEEKTTSNGLNYTSYRETNLDKRFGKDQGRCRGRGKGRGRGPNSSLPAGKVTFVASAAAGSFSSNDDKRNIISNNRQTDDETGISVLDGIEPRNKNDLVKSEEETIQWPPVVAHELEPMKVPFIKEPMKTNDWNGYSHEFIIFDEKGNSIVEDDTLFFFQIPSKLPLQEKIMNIGKNSTNETNTNSSNKKVMTKKKIITEDKVPEEKVFETINQGYLGTLQIRRSGRMTLKLGDKCFDVSSGETPAFFEEAYSLNKKEKDLRQLGTITKHLVITPDFDSLLNQSI